MTLTARLRPTVEPAVVSGGDLDLAFWSFLHCMVILELDNRHPRDADIDAAWTLGLKAFSQP